MLNIVLASASTQAPHADDARALWSSGTGLRAKVFKGGKARPYFNDIAELRISMFKDFPYLYEGNIEHEASYLEMYFK